MGYSGLKLKVEELLYLEASLEIIGEFNRPGSFLVENVDFIVFRKLILDLYVSNKYITYRLLIIT